MIRYLHIALWIVCFYDAIVMLLLPSSVNFILGTDGSAARYVVDFMALAIAGYVLCVNGFNKLENKWIAIFILTMVVSHFHSPNINFQSVFIPKDMALYNYKPMFETLIFLFLFIGIMSIKFTQNSINKIFKSLCWIAVIYSIYIIFQKFGMDQFYKVSGEVRNMSRNPEIGGFISQPVFAAAFLAMCLPFLFRNGSYWMIAAVILGILCTGNRSAVIASIISSIMFFPRLLKTGLILFLAYASFLVGSLIVYSAWPNFTMHFSDTGRLEVWKNLFFDFINPTFPGINAHYILTGHGIGSFPVIFPFYHHSSFYQAHNEFFAVIWGMGLVGSIVFYFMIKDLIKQVAPQVIFCSLMAISVCAMTNAVWHIPQIAFITVFLIGLAYNQSLKQGAIHVT